jgi:hypothetical protein
MNRKASTLVGIVAAGTLFCAPAIAQSSSPSEKIADIKNMTVKQWEKLEAKFKNEHAKWESCEAQAKEQKFKGRRVRWSFLYNCMTK